MIAILFSFLIAAMTSNDAVCIVLNSPSSSSKRRYEEARAMVQRDAEAGKPLQQFVVGVTTSGKQAEKYLDAARPKIMQMAEKKNNSLAWYILSMEKNDVKLLERAAKGGNVQALNALGSINTQMALASKTITTNELEKVLHESFLHFGQAAAKKDANGYINLGTCYLKGFGCDMDWNLAFECFKSAAEAGHPEGMDNMSACYQLGHGVPKNDELSLYWHMKAKSARGDEAARRWLEAKK